MAKGNEQVSTSSSSLSSEFMPDLKGIVDESKRLYEGGELGKVAGASDIQQSVFESAEGKAGTGIGAITEAQDVARQATTGGGIFGIDTEGLKEKAIAEAKGAWAPVADAQATAGLTGGSRSMLQEGARDAQLARELAGIDYSAGQEAREAARWGAGALMSGGQAEAGTTRENLGALAGLGGMQRDISQEQLDAEALALERYANVFGSTAGTQQESTTTTTGGGK
jgi:hypothetical protein